MVRLRHSVKSSRSISIASALGLSPDRMTFFSHEHIENRETMKPYILHLLQQQQQKQTLDKS